jgi:hypothetical protein
MRDGFRADGEVRLNGATIGGTLECHGAQIRNAGKTALTADGLNLKGSAFLRDGFKVEGLVNLQGATIGGSLECEGAQILNSGKTALAAAGLELRGRALLNNGFKADGDVLLVNAMIGGDLECGHGQFLNACKVAVNAEGLNLRGSAFLSQGFRAEGEVDLFVASIGKNLVLDGGTIRNAGKTALIADGLKVEGAVQMRDGFEADGEVRLLGATIGGTLECDGAQIRNAGQIALDAEGLDLKGSAFLRNGFKAEGLVDFTNSTIGRNLIWMGVSSPQDIVLDLRGAKIGTLRDEEKSWPGQGKLLLAGLVYDRLADDSPNDSQARLRWLRRQEKFHPQPYRQLAALLRQGGLDDEAREILIAKEQDEARGTPHSSRRLLWVNLLGPIIGYGYYPLRAFWYGLAFVVAGWFLFELGYRNGLITAKEREAYTGTENTPSELYPKFNSLLYSIDVFVPVINLFQREYWFPNARRGRGPNLGRFTMTTGALLRYYWWSHIVSGWIITSLLVAGLLGLIQHD